MHCQSSFCMRCSPFFSLACGTNACKTIRRTGSASVRRRRIAKSFFLSFDLVVVVDGLAKSASPHWRLASVHALHARPYVLRNGIAFALPRTS
jgi:hypothetical protein